MKKHYRFLILLAFVFFSLTKATAQAINYGPYKLFSSCSFNTDGTDSLGNDNLLIKNATIIDDPQRGKVVSISKSNMGYLEYEKTPLLVDTFTVAFWYYWDQENNDTQWQSIFIFTKQAITNTHFYLTPCAWNTTGVSMVVGSKASANVWQSLNATSYHLQTNHWYHIAVTVQGSTVSTYIDGELTATGTITATPVNVGAEKYYFGADPDLNKIPQTARFDDIKIFHQVLLGNQIKALFKGQPIPAPIGPLDFVKLTVNLKANDADYIFLSPNPISTTVSVYSILSQPVSVVLKEMITTDDYKPIRVDSSLVVVNPGNNTFNFSYKATNPGFYRYTAYLEKDGYKGDSRKMNVGFEPEKIISPVDTLPGFTAFWDDTRKQLDAIAPNYVVTKDATLSSAQRNIYVVEMTSFNNERIKGYYAEPTKPGKYPVNMVFMGYGVAAFAPSNVDNGFAEFIVSARGQGLNVPSGQNYWQGKYGDYLTYGLDSKENYFYRGAFMDLIRAVDFVCTRAEVDTTQIVAQGISQGGGYTFAVSALDKRIKACVPQIPFLSDWRDYFNIVPWPASNFSTYLSQHPESSWDKIFSVLSYFDIKNLAGMIKCPLLMCTGVQDETCPDHINFAAYNQVKTDKSYISYPLNGHAVSSDFTTYSWQWLRSKLAVLSPNALPLTQEEKIHVFPNPFTDSISISGLAMKTVKLLDEKGVEQPIKISSVNNGWKINTSALKKGVYLVSVQTDTGIVSRKILK